MALHILHPQWSTDRRIDGVLFDMDGLVLDSERLYTRFWMEAAHAFGYPMTLQQALGMRSLSRGPGQAHLTACFGSGVDYMVLREKRIELMDAYVQQHGIAPKPGIYALLDYLEEHSIPAAITSSSPMESIQRHLTDNHLCHRFQKLCSGHDVPHGKPEPDIYLHGAASLGASPRHCLALEDSPAGILSAYRAGCLPVMIPDQDQPNAVTAEMLYAKADSLTDVIPLLETFCRRRTYG